MVDLLPIAFSGEVEFVRESFELDFFDVCRLNKPFAAVTICENI